MSGEGGGAVRRAGVGDAEALVALRALMFEGMGVDPGGPQAPWRAAATAWFARRLAERGAVAAFVVDEPGAGAVSCALGVVEVHAPGPGSPSGAHGRLSSVSTAPRARRRGHARACVTALLAWFDAETDVRVVDLFATGDGAGLYRSLGFDVPRSLALQRRLPPSGGPHRPRDHLW